MVSRLTGQAASQERGPYRRPPKRSVRRAVRSLHEWPVLFAWRSLEWIFGLVPPRLGVPVMQVLLTLAYYAWPPKAGVMRSNMTHVLGLPGSDPRVAAMTRRAYRTYGRYVAELLRLPSRAVEEIMELMDEHQLDGFLALRDESHGLIVVSAHIGNGEAMIAAFAHLGLPANVLADDSSQRALFEHLNGQRLRWGVRMIPWKNLREVYRVLRRGEILGLTVDWGYRPGDIPVRLFDTWTTLPGGAAMLAARTGVLIVPVFSYRQANGRYFAFHTEPIRVADDSAAEIQRATQQIADALTKALRRAPEQWYSFQRMWPRTTEEQADLADRAAGLHAAQPAGGEARGARPQAAGA